mmetsp:Transcript_4059/g.9224  ORF Transcript_4059/g.9224 Transcript_4059/m.9224 type:complete len:112 (+) Transcript_4059:394-729(+)
MTLGRRFRWRLRFFGAFLGGRAMCRFRHERDLLTDISLGNVLVQSQRKHRAGDGEHGRREHYGALESNCIRADAPPQPSPRPNRIVSELRRARRNVEHAYSGRQAPCGREP